MCLFVVCFVFCFVFVFFLNYISLDKEFFENQRTSCFVHRGSYVMIFFFDCQTFSCIVTRLSNLQVLQLFCPSIPCLGVKIVFVRDLTVCHDKSLMS